MTENIDWEAEMEALDASLPERLERAAQMAERSDIWTDTERLMPAAGIADLIWEAHSEILGWRALNRLRQDSRTCPLGEDCDLTVAWMAGRESAKDEYKARTEKLDAKLDAAREEGRREEREACYQRAYEYGCVWQELRGLALNSSCPEDATKHLASEQAAFAIAEAIRARAAELKGEKK